MEKITIFGELANQPYNRKVNGRAENKTIQVDFDKLREQLEKQHIVIIPLEQPN